MLLELEMKTVAILRLELSQCANDVIFSKRFLTASLVTMENSAMKQR